MDPPPKRVTPATVQFVDIAGLVKGASQGEGLGNKFLSHIRETDAVVQVVRCFDDPDLTHVMGSVDPVRDREVIEFELALADLATIERRIDRVQRAARSGDKDANTELPVLERAQAVLNQGKALWEARPSEADIAMLRPLQLLTTSPCSMRPTSATTHCTAMRAHTWQPCARPSRRAASGEHAEIVPFSAKIAAGAIHTDFQRGFIRAETVGAEEMSR